MGDISNNFINNKTQTENKVSISDLIKFTYKKDDTIINNILYIFNKVFIYDYNKRLVIKDIISKHML